MDDTPALLSSLEHDVSYVRAGAAQALVEAVEHWPTSVGDAVARIKSMRVEKAKATKPEFDQYAMLVEGSLERADPWAARAAVSVPRRRAGVLGDMRISGGARWRLV